MKSILFLLHDFFCTFLLINCLSFVTMYYLDILSLVFPSYWLPDSGITLENVIKFFKGYKREVKEHSEEI